MADDNVVKLHEFTADEWRDVIRKVAPWITDDDFYRMWDNFCKFRAGKRKH